MRKILVACFVSQLKIMRRVAHDANLTLRSGARQAIWRCGRQPFFENARASLLATNAATRCDARRVLRAACCVLRAACEYP